MAEKSALSHTHSVIYILKSESNKHFNLIAYQAIKGHIILLLTNLSHFLSLLLYPNIISYDLIDVV